MTVAMMMVVVVVTGDGCKGSDGIVKIEVEGNGGRYKQRIVKARPGSTRGGRNTKRLRSPKPSPVTNGDQEEELPRIWAQ